MAKKQKRQVSSGTRTETTPTYTPNPALRRVSTAVEFHPDYSVVISDLKRIGILAGSFFVILIGLSFILH
jgi:hypothetical protein